MFLKIILFQGKFSRLLISDKNYLSCDRRRRKFFEIEKLSTGKKLKFSEGIPVTW